MFRRMLIALGAALLIAGCASPGRPARSGVYAIEADAVGVGYAAPLVVERMEGFRGFVRDAERGRLSSWHDARRNEVVIFDARAGRSIVLRDLPHSWGPVASSGWEERRGFFIRFERARDDATRLFVDPDDPEEFEIEYDAPRR